MGKFNVTVTDVSGQIHDRYQMPTQINGSYVGGTGGQTTQVGRQIQPTVKVGTATATTGNIIAAKGSKKFRVSDNATPNNTGSCSLVNLATPTAANTMSIQINTAYLGAANVAVQGSAVTYTYITWATANVAGPVATAVGSVITGTGITGTVTVATLATANGLANANVSFSSQTVSAVNYSSAIYTSVYASRITNKYVYDFGSDGYLSTNTGGGYNPNKYRYHLATPDSTFVMVAYA